MFLGNIIAWFHIVAYIIVLFSTIALFIVNSIVSHDDTNKMLPSEGHENPDAYVSVIYIISKYNLI